MPDNAQPSRRRREIKRDDKGRRSLIVTLADDWAIEPEKLLSVVRSQCFPSRIKVKGQGGSYQWRDFTATDEQVMALLIIAVEHRLNPLLGELAPRIQFGQVKPVIPIDGWIKLANGHSQLDGITTEYLYIDGRTAAAGDKELPLACRCTIYRKDRKHPVIAEEWMSECVRDTDPWKQHPRRMIRHKAIAQCARIAFGFAFQDAEELAEDAEFEIVPPKQVAAPNTVSLKVGPDSIDELKEKNGVASKAEAQREIPPEPKTEVELHPSARANQHMAMRVQINKWLDQLCGDDDLTRIEALERWSGAEKVPGPAAESLPDESVKAAWANAAKEWTQKIGKGGIPADTQPKEDREPTKPKHRTKREKVAA